MQQIETKLSWLGGLLFGSGWILAQFGSIHFGFVILGISDKFRGKSAQGLFGDVMMEVDWSVGQIMETLKKNDLDQNTLVIYTSDNGPCLNFGNHAGLAFPLREGKGTIWEGGNRVPTGNEDQEIFGRYYKHPSPVRPCWCEECRALSGLASRCRRESLAFCG